MIVAPAEIRCLEGADDVADGHPELRVEIRSMPRNKEEHADDGIRWPEGRWTARIFGIGAKRDFQAVAEDDDGRILFVGAKPRRRSCRAGDVEEIGGSAWPQSAMSPVPEMEREGARRNRRRRRRIGVIADVGEKSARRSCCSIVVIVM